MHASDASRYYVIDVVGQLDARAFSLLATALEESREHAGVWVLDLRHAHCGHPDVLGELAGTIADLRIAGIDVRVRGANKRVRTLLAPDAVDDDVVGIVGRHLIVARSPAPQAA